jgi:tripartite-type tricarboxylate transporter receptor subunit TctC
MRSSIIVAATMLGAAFALTTQPAKSQTYPDHTIRLVLPYAPGGGVDILGRLLAQKMTEAMGQPVVVDNRGGGAGMIGTGIVVKAPPDGYTVLLAAIELGANPALHDKMPYDAIKDLQPVTLVATLPALLVVTNDFPATTVKDTIAVLRAHPGQYNYASSGYGSMHFLAAELFKSMNNVDIVHIPYQSGGQALAALLGGQAQIAFSTVPPVLKQVQAGSVRGVAVTGKKRQDSLPNVPTFIEAGYPDFDASLWEGILVPAGTPKEVVTKLNVVINRILEEPDVKAKLNTIGADPVGTTPEAFGRFIQQETSRWNKLIKPAMRAAGR